MLAADVVEHGISVGDEGAWGLPNSRCAMRALTSCILIGRGLVYDNMDLDRTGAWRGACGPWPMESVRIISHNHVHPNNMYISHVQPPVKNLVPEN